MYDTGNLVGIHCERIEEIVRAVVEDRGRRVRLVLVVPAQSPSAVLAEGNVGFWSEVWSPPHPLALNPRAIPRNVKYRPSMAFVSLFFQLIMSCECFSVGYLMKGNHPYMRWGRDATVECSRFV